MCGAEKVTDILRGRSVGPRALSTLIVASSDVNE
jgi:hypothetical protein